MNLSERGMGAMDLSIQDLSLEEGRVVSGLIRKAIAYVTENPDARVEAAFDILKFGLSDEEKLAVKKFEKSFATYANAGED